LQEELRGNHDAWKQTKRSKLLPSQPPPRIVRTSIDDDLWKRIRSEAYQLRFVLFRFRFHVVEGFRYLIEASRWKRRLRASSQYKTDLIVD
jgi:hypothetical protein